MAGSFDISVLPQWEAQEKPQMLNATVHRTCFCCFVFVIALIEHRTFGRSLLLVAADFAVRAQTNGCKHFVATSGKSVESVAMPEIPQGSAIYFGVQGSAFSIVAGCSPELER